MHIYDVYINRENYYQPVSMASFKESGAIEYSSDVLIGCSMPVGIIERTRKRRIVRRDYGSYLK